ncbi:hypothetical protein BDZ94DRAFT_1241108 [Collybia nuda]|uniref:DUF6533 domain-containing protein n=1 Tax=Collybia nuda TaxID=64659 RepID=A0A9P5XUC1_9AGAR|nr:hypothetical protein BDZ94DRAFT_1241108 [Collybia nuda]
MSSTLALAHSRQLSSIFYKYVTVASLVIFVYDYFHTLGLERKHVWKANGMAGKVLFFLNRYPPFVDVSLAAFYYLNRGLSSESCSALVMVIVWMTFVGILMSEAYCFYVISFIYDIDGSPPQDGILGCYDTEDRDVFFVVFVLLLLNETAISLVFILLITTTPGYEINQLILDFYASYIVSWGRI